jgi:Zn-dependent peptidase ImmA (M78 family)
MQRTLQLSLKTLEWAANKAGSSLSEFAHTLYSKEETVTHIANGQLTVSQIRKFADHAKIPFGFLFLETPPQRYTPDHTLVDFRTAKHNQPLSEDFFDVYKDIEHKQSWYRDYLLSIDAEKLSFVGKYRGNKSIQNDAIAKDIRNTLGIANVASSKINPEDYLLMLSNLCEDAGILVFKNSVVVNSTKRKLDTEEFRGFVISDDYSPAIFINGSDAKFANIFTLAHELAHIWLGETGISDVSASSANKNEIRCNAIAAEILVPKNDFLQDWDSSVGTHRDKISALNRRYKVSELVIARVALTNHKITYENYQEIYTEVLERVREKKRRDKEAQKELRLPLSVTAPIKNSRRLTRTIVELISSGRMGPSEGAILLNTSAAKVVSLL